MRIAFDIGGVISKHPDLYRELMQSMDLMGIEVYILTDMHPFEKVCETLTLNHIPFTRERVLVADYDGFGDMCKDVLLREHKIDMFFDDFIGYVVGDGSPIRCLVMPDATAPYYHESWKTVGDGGNFGRRTYTKVQAKGKDI